MNRTISNKLGKTDHFFVKKSNQTNYNRSQFHISSKSAMSRILIVSISEIAQTFYFSIHLVIISVEHKSHEKFVIFCISAISLKKIKICTILVALKCRKNHIHNWEIFKVQVLSLWNMAFGENQKSTIKHFDQKVETENDWNNKFPQSKSKMIGF